MNGMNSYFRTFYALAQLELCRAVEAYILSPDESTTHVLYTTIA